MDHPSVTSHAPCCADYAVSKRFCTEVTKPPALSNPYRKENSMTVRIVQLGSARLEDEGTRIGTVRRPPRGVPKAEFAARNYYDVWFPNLAPSAETMKLGQEASTPTQWAAFTRKYRAEMSTPDASHTLELLAVMSKQSNFSVGCYCEDESHCHRAILRALLVEKGAALDA